MQGTMILLEGGALLYAPPEGAKALIVLCCGDDRDEFAARVEALEKGGACPALLSPRVENWDDNFTPWPAEVLPGRAFTGGGEALNTLIEDELLPAAIERLPMVTHVGIAGYSLGGLFALWAACRPKARYSAAACMSGSLWYPGFMDWLRASAPEGLRAVYLSLGLKEAKRARGIMAENGPAAAQALALFKARLGEENAILEWNNGDHFFEVDRRVEKGLNWMTAHMA